MAPPCTSFSRARDRSGRTRLRTRARPEGLYVDDPATVNGNLIARLTAESVAYLVDSLGATGTWEQPDGSYMWPYLDHIGILAHLPREDLLLHQCRFGRPFRKPTIFATFGPFVPKELAKTCSSKPGRPSCGCWSWSTPQRSPLLQAINN